MADKREQFVAEIRMETDRLQVGIKSANATLESFESKANEVFTAYSKAAMDNIARVNAQLEREGKEFAKYTAEQSKAIQGLQSQLQLQTDVDLAGQFGDIANRGKEMVGSFLAAAGQIEQFRLTLTTLAGTSAEADKELAKLREYANLTPFDLAGVVGAGVQMRSLQVDVDRFLPLAGDLASVFNRDIRDAAQALSKALSGSQDGIEVLNDSFGITRKDLKAAGAVIKSTGAISLDTSEDLKKLADAIEKVARQKNFVGAVNTQLTTLSANVSQAEDAAFNLAAAVGETLSPLFIKLAQVATNVLDTMAALPKPMLAVAGVGATVATTVGLLGGAGLTLNAAVSGLAPFVGKLVPAMVGLKAGASGAAVAFSPLLAGFSSLMLIGGGALLAINNMEQGAKELEQRIVSESKELAAINVEFFRYRDAVAAATGAQREFVRKGEDVATTLEKVRGVLKDTSGADFLAGLQTSGIGFRDLLSQSEKANEELERLEARKAAINKVLPNLTDSPGIIAISDKDDRNKISENIQNTFGRSVDRSTAIKELAEIERKQASIRQNADGLLAPAIQKAAPAYAYLSDAIERANKLAADFKITGDTDSLERNNDLLKATSKEIMTIKSQLTHATGGNLDVGSVTALQDRLTSGKTSDQEAAAIRGLLEALTIRNKLQKQGVELAEAAVRPRVEAALEEARGLETSRERIKALHEVLKTEGLSANQRKAITAEISREEKTLNAEMKQASKDRVQQAIFEAQQVRGSAQEQIAALRQVLEQHKIEGAERRRIINEINTLEAQVAKEREQRRKAEQDALTTESQRQQELLIAALDERIAKLRQEADEGKNTWVELEALLQERTAREVDLIEQKTAARKAEADSSKVADQIEVTGALEVEAARRAGTAAIEEQKKAQDERIKKLRQERMEALKAAKEEKAARKGVADATSDAATSSQWSPLQSQGPLAQPITSTPGQFMGTQLSPLGVDFSAESVRRRTDEIRANRTTKEEDRKAAFEAGNAELVARVLEEDVRRREELSKKDAERQEAARKTAASDLEADSARRAASQALADNSRRLDAMARTANLEGRVYSQAELEERFSLTARRFEVPAPRPLAVEGYPTVAAGLASRPPLGASRPAASAPQGKSSSSSQVTIKLEFDQPIKNAEMKNKADLGGKVGDLQRQGKNISFRVNT